MYHSKYSVTKYITLLCVILFHFLLPLPASGAISTDRGGLHAITLSHGLSDLLVNRIYKTSDGYVWFGTESSVDRFDGNQIKRFPLPGDKHKSRRVLCFWEMPGHILYIGTNQGLYSLNTEDPHITAVKPDKFNFPILSLSGDEEGQLFIGSPYGLYIYNTRKGSIKHKFLEDDNLSEKNNVKGILVEDNSTLWLLSPHRLWEMNLKTDGLTPYLLPVSSESTRLCEAGGKIFIGTSGNGVIPFNINDKKFGSPINVGNDIVNSLESAPGNELIIGTDGEGVFFYSVDEGAITAHLTSSSSSAMQLRSNSVYSVLKDDKGILWVGYYQSGVDYAPIKKYMPMSLALPEELGINQEMIRSFEKGEGFTIIGTHEGLVAIEDANGNARKFSTPEISSNLILSLKHHNGNFYVGTYHGGLYKLNPEKGSLVKFGPKELVGGSIFEIETDQNNDLWVATSEGLFRFKDEQGNNFELYNSKNSQLPPGNVYEIYFDSLGRGWIGTENGLAIWNGQYIQTSGFPSGFIDKMKIRVVFEDKDHQLYFAPDRGVIWTSDLSLQNFMPLEEGDDERFTQITSIIEDKGGWLWAGTDKGLFSINKKSPTHFMVYNYIGGVLNPIYTLSHPYEEENGDLWFGSTTGLHKVDFERVKKERENIKVPTLIISDVQSAGKSIAGIDKDSEGDYVLQLESDQKDLSLFLTDLNYNFRDSFEIEYKIWKEGVENEWKWVSGGEPIVLNDLPEDNFILTIKVAGIPESQINVNVKRHRQFPWWWIALGGLLILMSIWGVFYFKHRRELRKLKKTEDPYHLQPVQKETSSAETAAEEDNKPYRTTRLTEEECKRLIKKLTTVMKTEKPYINPNLKIKDLASMIDTSAHSLSFLFNQYLDKSYYDYVNEYRVNEFKTMVKEIDLSKYTLSTMAEKCGFSSRASFFRHFKAVTGLTPAEYLKQNQAQ